MTSHAVGVARGMGKCAVVGAGSSGMAIITNNSEKISDKKSDGSGVKRATKEFTSGQGEAGRQGQQGGQDWSKEEVTSRLVCADGITTLKSGDIITLDGGSGLVYLGTMPLVPAGNMCGCLCIRVINVLMLYEIYIYV